MAKDHQFSVRLTEGQYELLKEYAELATKKGDITPGYEIKPTGRLLKILALALIMGRKQECRFPYN